MSASQNEIDAFTRLQATLERDHLGKWVVIHDCEVIGFYPLFETAADDAVQRFGSGPFLIRQIGAPPMVLPASVMFRPDAKP